MAKKKKKEQKKLSNRARILMRYGIISAALVVFAVAIVGRLVSTTVIKAEAWNSRADAIMNELNPIAPERGNILADNGNILACNLTVYDINFDMRHQRIKEFGKKIPWASIDSLADSLDVHFPLNGKGGVASKDSTNSWHSRLKKEFEKQSDKRPRALRLARKASQEDFEKIKSFPFFNTFKGKGTRNPVYTESKTVRIYPFGKMAYRSIGRVNENDKTKEIHGYSGLEKDLDALLYGKPGYEKKVMMTSGMDNWVEQPAQRGYDVQTTINIDMQDMLEEELTKVCEEHRALWGTALLMEVETGEIKAVANVELLDDGSYGEALNRAVRRFEPGSVIKPISLMIAFEDGLVNKVTDAIDCSPFQMTKDGHAPPVKTMKQVIEMSSNTGISRVMFRGYSKDPESFHERLRSIGFLDHMNSGISGEEVPFLASVGPKDRAGRPQTMTARHLTLARQCYGYSSEIPPLYTLAYYNAIANGGKMVKPHLVKRLTNETSDSVVNLADLTIQVCSEATAQKVRECLVEPVWGKHGTAQAVQDDRVKIAGKTGTAYPIPDKGGAYDKTKRRLAFAGFFPADNPKYSCMALILAPEGNSAAKTSGQVVKNMAIKMFSRGMLNNISTYTEAHADSRPVLSISEQKNNSTVRNHLGIKSSATFANKRNEDENGVVPDLSGYDLPSALRILEQKGYKVSVEGAGYVVGQLPAGGDRLPRGGSVHLSLRN